MQGDKEYTLHHQITRETLPKSLQTRKDVKKCIYLSEAKDNTVKIYKKETQSLDMRDKFKIER